MSRAPRAAAVLFTTLLMLLSAAPALAADPVRRAGAAPESSVEPTGVLVCDVKLSKVDGPLVDANFSVRAWEPFIVWGFGYPPEATITLEFIDSLGGIFTFDAITDSAGEFAGDFSFTPEPDTIYPETFSLTAVPVGGGCIDGITLTIQRRLTPSPTSTASRTRSPGSTARASPEAAPRHGSARAIRSRAVRWPPS